jgi:serine phosphatase RsbU (regulator of sigma subunit)
MFPTSDSDNADSAVIEEGAAGFPEISGAEIAAACHGERIGGDFYDCFRASSERILFGLLDVAGSREGSLQILSVAKTLFRDLGLELFSPSDINESESMSELGTRLNQEILKIGEGIRSCPAFIGCYHEKFGTLCYTNAGHIPGLLVDACGIVDLPATGLPLGLFSHATCDAPIAGMAPGARLLLVSRGVVEGRCRKNNPEEPEFGLDRVREVLRSNPHSSALSLCSSTLVAASTFACESSSLDDMTALALVRTS